MAKITIHTATYNRAYILGKAYNSLKNQTCKDFEWIITDDGSTDNTEKMVKEWIARENEFHIQYNKLPHVGIPRALNSGISLAQSDWFMRLDSDDTILPNTVELVIEWLKEIEDDERFAGIGFARCFPNGKYMKNQEPLIDKEKGYVDATHLERKKYHLDMDMCEVHRTSLLRKYPLQYWENEKFAPEQLSLYQLAFKGFKLRWRSKKLYICDYLPDGLTRDDRIVKNNPMGFAMMYNQNLLIHQKLKEKCFDAMQMIALTLYAGHPEYLLKGNKKLVIILMLPFGLILSIRRVRQYARLS